MQWISLKDRIPEENKRFLTYRLTGGGYKPRLRTAMWRWDNFAVGYYCDQPTHWMPLPEPPESEDSP